MEAGARAMTVVDDYRERLAANPNDLDALIFLGNANFDIQRYDAALELYRRALALDARNIRVRTDMASALRHTGKLDEALAELRRVLAQEPTHPAALYNLGWMLANDKNDLAGADDNWTRLLEQHPDYPEAANVKQALEEIRKRRGAKPPAG
jgi:tetratricopeptide (TPR) repeat protein